MRIVGQRTGLPYIHSLLAKNFYPKAQSLGDNGDILFVAARVE